MDGVVLYSGRWRPNVETLVSNHRRYLIDPHHLDVVVVGMESQICNMRNFSRSVRAAWGFDETRLLVSQHHDYKKKTIPTGAYGLSAWKAGQLRIWEVQFSHVRLAFQRALEWKKHNIFIRARIDQLFTARVPIPLVIHRQVFAIAANVGHWSTSASEAPSILRDWFYLTDAEGMRIITNTSAKFINMSARCFAACPEEQVEAHIRKSVYTAVPINVTLVKVSKSGWCSSRL